MEGVRQTVVLYFWCLLLFSFSIGKLSTAFEDEKTSHDKLFL